MPGQAPAPDAVNRRTYGLGAIVGQYARAEGWLDPGEEAAFQALDPAARGGPVLDIGVGGGRTVPLMRALGGEYAAIDYSPAMVRACQARFPDARFEEMDARALRFADASFALASFSFNGIDSVAHADRARVLAEVRRVLRPGGGFVFSSLNRHGPLCRPTGPNPLAPAPSRLPAPVRLLRRVLVGVLGRWNRRRTRAAQVMEAERALVVIPNHAYGVLAAFISPPEQARELQAAGFRLLAVFDTAGRRVGADERPAEPFYFHYVARRSEG